MDDVHRTEDGSDQDLDQKEVLELAERLRPAPPERDSSGGYEIKPPKTRH